MKSSRRDLSRTVLGVALIVVTIVLSVLAVRCISTEMYKLYSSRCAEWTQSAADKQALADEARASGQMASIISGFERSAEQFSQYAKEASDYLLLHRLGAAALGIGALVSLMGVITCFFRKKKTVEPVVEETPNTEN